MAIATLKPITPQPSKENLPQIRKNSVSDVVVCDIAQPLSQLSMYVDGSSWAVNYYSQVKVPDNATSSLDTNASGIQQQYQKIFNFELRVTQGLTADYDSTTGLTRVNGTASVYPLIVSLVDDMFTADAGSGRTGIYRVNNVERASLALQTQHVINYTLVSFIDENPLEYANLEDKVIRNYYFDKDRISEGGTPLLKEEDHNSYGHLEEIFRDIVTYYFDTFYNAPMQAIIIPGQKSYIVDTFLLEFLLSIIEVGDHPYILKHRRFFTDNDFYMEQNNIWDMLLYRDIKMLSQINNKYHYQAVSGFNKNSWLKGLAYSGIKYVAYPTVIDTSIRSELDPTVKLGAVISLEPTTNRQGQGSASIIQTQTVGNSNYVKIFPVLTDDFYVLSQSFYSNSGTLSLLEKLVLQFVKKEPIDPQELKDLLSEFRNWARLEQYYYLPICLLMVKQCRLELYS